MTNYSRGADFERAVKADLELAGWVAIRAAGSHGIMDLVACRRGSLISPLLVQCKLDGKMGPADRRELARVAYEAGAVPVMASRPRRGKILYRRYYVIIDKWGEVEL